MRLYRAALLFVFAAVPITLLCLMVYAAAQGVYRQSLNDPQVQMAEDVAARLQGGEVPAALVGRNEPPVDIGASLAPWIAIYDASGTPLESSAVLDNAPPQLPQGVFDNVDFWRHGHTWQPREGVRQAVVVIKTPNGRYFVAAGRNMREVESRISLLGRNILLGWLIILGAILLCSFFYATIFR